MKQPRFANGRSVRNALDRVRMRQAIRLYNTFTDGDGDATLTKADLVGIRPDDITQSRVFEGGVYGEVPERAEE
ncbi:MAG: hypothetical protein M3N68_13960 [Actinomycetota bacterium]|nr:hypothetical protein [Actinomycetota bacterium]